MKVVRNIMAAAALSIVGLSAASSLSANASWSWSYNSYWPSNNYFPSNAFSGGWYSPSYGGNSLYVCRTFGDYGGSSWFYGNYYNGGCSYSYGGRSNLSYGFGILSGLNRYHWYNGSLSRSYRPWSPWLWNESHESAEASTQSVGTEICRADVNGNMVPGQYIDGNCHIPFQGIEIIRPEFELLVIDE